MLVHHAPVTATGPSSSSSHHTFLQFTTHKLITLACANLDCVRKPANQALNEVVRVLHTCMDIGIHRPHLCMIPDCYTFGLLGTAIPYNWGILSDYHHNHVRHSLSYFVDEERYKGSNSAVCGGWDRLVSRAFTVTCLGFEHSPTSGNSILFLGAALCSSSRDSVMALVFVCNPCPSAVAYLQHSPHQNFSGDFVPGVLKSNGA